MHIVPAREKKGHRLQSLPPSLRSSRDARQTHIPRWQMVRHRRHHRRHYLGRVAGGLALDRRPAKRPAVAQVRHRHHGVGVWLFGRLHGVAFLFYVAVALYAWGKLRWPLWAMLVALLAAIPPLVTVPVEIWFRRAGLRRSRRGAGAG